MANHLAQQIWVHFTNEILPVNMLTERTAEQKDDIFSKLARFLLEVSNSVPPTEVNSILMYYTCMVILYFQYRSLYKVIFIMMHAKTCYWSMAMYMHIHTHIHVFELSYFLYHEP